MHAYEGHPHMMVITPKMQNDAWFGNSWLHRFFGVIVKGANNPAQIPIVHD